MEKQLKLLLKHLLSLNYRSIKDFHQGVEH